MLTDAALRATFRNFSTLFLLVATLTVPLHLAHAYVFRDVIAVTELHGAIDTFPEGRQVRGVDRAAVASARLSLLGLTAIEIAAIPLLVRAARAVVTAGEEEVPTVVGAYRSLPTRRPAARSLRAVAPAVVAAVVFAAAVAWLARLVGSVLVEPLPDARAFVGVGLAEASARALGGAFLVGSVAYLRSGPKDT
jgi:hypothetical protein